jgi:mono/diheme cytochrome c family protein
MKQVVDLEGHAEFQSLGVQLIAVSTDPVPALAKAVEEWSVKAPHLSDAGAEVSRRYGVLKWATPLGEPGHTFVLVGQEGKVTWIRDYGASENGGLMYVPPDDLYQEVIKQLPSKEQSHLPAPERGARLYEANCLQCHRGAAGGAMMDIPPRHNANGHTWHHPDCQLVETVLNGSGAMGGMMRQMMGAPEDTPRMPAFQGQLTEEEVLAILAYIKTWWTEEQRAWQAQVSTRAVC